MPDTLFAAAAAGNRPGGMREAGVRASARAEILRRANRPDISLALWHRDAASLPAAWLNSLPPETTPDGRVLVAPGRANAALTALFDEARTPATGERAAVIGDMSDLVSRFAEIAGTPLVDVRVDRIAGDACWKFHRDNVRLRLLATYRGPGTEWVSRDRAETAIAQQRAYRGPIHRFPPFSVGLFKGSLAGPDTGIVHRSPPIAGSETVRLLLCLNLPSRMSPELSA